MEILGYEIFIIIIIITAVFIFFDRIIFKIRSKRSLDKELVIILLLKAGLRETAYIKDPVKYCEFCYSSLDDLDYYIDIFIDNGDDDDGVL